MQGGCTMKKAKTEREDLRSEEGMKSRGDDYKGVKLRILRTLEGNTGGREKSVKPVSGRSGKTRKK